MNKGTASPSSVSTTEDGGSTRAPPLRVLRGAEEPQPVVGFYYRPQAQRQPVASTVSLFTLYMELSKASPSSVSTNEASSSA
ncbi:hypothetical protein NDU88_000103 [Pleurodeles waltl]|uniref:Uncharacterized protein n=1 Tax=Pleurodeles waltl TaxID=8319 RepID=A0AAV7KLI0_PLEWA|nr:hypothetical protein NDU88_000103 [Pleurodeles waltl]